MAPIRIVLADDHGVVRAGLRLLLDADPDFEVVAEAADVDGALRAVLGHTPDVLVLALTSAAVGLTTVSGQLLLPLAGDLATPGSRGRVVGTVAGGVLTGILVARIFSGSIAHVAGWRAVFVFAGTVSLLLALLVRRALPQTPPTTLARVIAVGRTSLHVEVDLIAEDLESGATRHATTGRFTFVAVDPEGHPLRIR